MVRSESMDKEVPVIVITPDLYDQGRSFPDKWHIPHRLGRIDEYPDNWESNTVINLTHLLKPDSVNIIFDCGTEDFFCEVNCNLLCYPSFTIWMESRCDRLCREDH